MGNFLEKVIVPLSTIKNIGRIIGDLFVDRETMRPTYVDRRVDDLGDVAFNQARVGESLNMRGRIAPPCFVLERHSMMRASLL